MTAPIDIVPDTRHAIDASDFVTHVCPSCESNMWRLVVWFQEFEIAGYFTEMECVFCGTRATAPTPLDDPGWTGPIEEGADCCT